MTHRGGSRNCKTVRKKTNKKKLLGPLLQSDLANDVDEISSLEGQLIWLVSKAVP